MTPFMHPVQVKDMEQGTEELVAIADLPSHVAKLVHTLGKRGLVATKRQAPPEQVAAAPTNDPPQSKQQSTKS